MFSKQTRNTRNIVLVMILFFMFTLACAITPSMRSRLSEVIPTQVVPTTSSLAPVQIEESADELLVELYKKVNPSVVNITTYALQNGEIVPYIQGSGFVYDSDRDIITNAHLVQDAEQVDIIYSDGSISSASLVGDDPNSDLAVLKAERMPDGVGFLPLGEMSDLAVGQSVIAVGNPFGLEGTLTRGIISALGRSIPAINQFSIPQSIQTDAAINPGNSGGPLLNLKGEVIGVNARIQTDGLSQSNSGVGFAIPVSIIQRVVPDIIQYGKTEWSWLGVIGGDVVPSLVKAMRLPVERGAYIFSVVPGGPAEQAGIQGVNSTVDVDGRPIDIGGDVVTAIDGQQVFSFNDLMVYLAFNTRPDQEVTLSVIRDGKTREFTLKLSARPDQVNLETLP